MCLLHCTNAFDDKCLQILLIFVIIDLLIITCPRLSKDDGSEAILLRLFLPVELWLEIRLVVLAWLRLVIGSGGWDPPSLWDSLCWSCNTINYSKVIYIFKMKNKRDKNIALPSINSTQCMTQICQNVRCF